MTTFENFKKSRSSSKSYSRISVQSQSPLDLQALHFSINEILFNYQEDTDILVNTDLKINNFSTQSIYFRIVGNAVQYYDIAPSQDILYPSTSCSIVFRFKKALIKISPNDHHSNNFAKIK